MKFYFIRKNILSAFATLTIVLTMSCSSDDTTIEPVNDLYLDIPDARFESILIEKGIDSDGEINHQLLRTDAAEVRVLNLNFAAGGEISDLTGIEGFLNLTKLSATQHSIAQIDLSGNTVLDSIYLSGNSINTIDLSYNPNLVLVDIQSNELHTIKGLSKAIHLKKLNLSFNNFEEFNIHNESLEVLHMSNNLLNAIDLNGAITLKNVLLTSNKITTVDLSTNLALETVLLSDNKIENIDLGYNRNLTHLYISSNSLTTLNVGYNQVLVELKADRNPALTCIKIRNGQEIPSVSTSAYQNLSSICN